jgi:hypothetical protein
LQIGGSGSCTSNGNTSTYFSFEDLAQLNPRIKGKFVILNCDRQRTWMPSILESRTLIKDTAAQALRALNLALPPTLKLFCAGVDIELNEKLSGEANSSDHCFEWEAHVLEINSRPSGIRHLQPFVQGSALSFKCLFSQPLLSPQSVLRCFKSLTENVPQELYKQRSVEVDVLMKSQPYYLFTYVEWLEQRGRCSKDERTSLQLDMLNTVNHLLQRKEPAVQGDLNEKLFTILKAKLWILKGMIDWNMKLEREGEGSRVVVITTWVNKVI